MNRKILVGDAYTRLCKLPCDSVDCVVTSPPYWGLRDYGIDGQLGLEPRPDMYIQKLRLVFDQIHHVLKPQGTLWLNIGDTQRDGFRARIPFLLCNALIEDGWNLVNDIVWHKTRVMPMGLKKRFLPDHEYLFFFSKDADYYFDQEAAKVSMQPESAKRYARTFRDVRSGSTKHLRVAGEICPRQGPQRKITAPERRIRRTVWSVCPAQFKGAHFATFPPELIEPCILAGCPKDGLVLDPFFGAGTTGLVAQKHGRRWIGIELNRQYAKMAWERLAI